METLFTSRLSGLEWGLLLASLLLIYLLLRLLYRFLSRTSVLGPFHARTKKLVFVVQLFFEPLAFIVLLISFVLIHPAFCGMLVLLLFWVGFNQFRNYMGGKLVQLNQMLETGKRLHFQDVQGIISEMGTLGLYLQTHEGRHFVSYAQLLTEGYTIVSGAEAGGYHQLKIENPQDESLISNEAQLMDMLTIMPFIDWNYKPEISHSEDAFFAKILVRDDRHLQELLELIHEKGLRYTLLTN